MSQILTPKRFRFLQLFVATLFVLISYQLLQLTVLRRASLVELAGKQHLLKIEIPPLRGQILDRTGKELATNLKVPSIYAVPRILSQKEKQNLIPEISSILELDKTFVEDRLSRDKAFIWLKRRVSFEQAKALRGLQSKGLGITDEYRRFYPQGDLLGHILGFTNVDGVGLEGIELYANKQLQGTPGLRYTKRDALGREIKTFEIKSIAAQDGKNITLTMDQYIQYLTERALENAYQKWNAKAGWAIVMEADTGRILAIANRPHFDPNDVASSDIETRRNRAITDMYEPGSVFKIVAASAVLNENLTTTETQFNCENGEYRYGSKVLHDVHGYGLLSFEDVIVKSSNIGTVKIASLMKPEVFYDYIRKFGFAQAAGIDFPGEASGFIRHPRDWSKTSPYNIPMGHEVMVTALQMTTALAVIANGGYLVQPYLIEKVTDQYGVVLHEKKPQIKRQVIRSEVAATMRRILRRVVEEGTGKKAFTEGIPLGGKTGTAQKVLPNGKGYSHDHFMSSFVGFGPVDRPKLVMSVVLDDPHPRYYGGTVAAPVFKEVMKPALLSLGYIPEDAKDFTPLMADDSMPPENPPTPLPTPPLGTRI